MKRIVPMFLSVLLLSASIILVGSRSRDQNIRPDIADATQDQATAIEEIRGIWVTYMTLDVEAEKDKEQAFKKKIDQIVRVITEDHLNAMIVQVRPFCDAIYPSKLFPWSHILTGEQGKDPGYDPLEYIINACHQSHIKVHAWINPYRVSTKETPTALSHDNPYMKDQTLGVTVNGATYLNPGDKRAQELITDGVKELVENYDIDGIQFDDYFYPEDCGDFDRADYEKYRQATDAPLSLAEYRKQNVSALIKRVYQAAHTGRGIQFGVSPQGNLENNRAIYADVETWCAEPGYLDYICPQIYFSLDNPAMTYENSLQSWLKLKKHTGLRLYIGLAVYKAGTNADEGTWLDNTDILKSEIEILREQQANGFILYSYDSLYQEESKEEIANVMRYLSTSPTQ